MNSMPKVLIVDDDPDILGFVQMVLEEEGYQTVTAHNGLEALCKVQEERPHLILLDLYMPVLDGWGFCRTLRERGPLSLPIVVMTADQSALFSARDEGLQGYLSKPFDLEELLSCVARCAALSVSADDVRSGSGIRGHTFPNACSCQRAPCGEGGVVVH